jgi:hypothetical protein
MADNPSKYDQLRKMREERALAAERLDVKKSVDVPSKKAIVPPAAAKT